MSPVVDAALAEVLKRLDKLEPRVRELEVEVFSRKVKRAKPKS